MVEKSITKVVVTGARGLLGTEFMSICEDRGWTAIAMNRDVTDLAHPEQANRFICEHAPDAIIHCAAETNVDLCEREPEWAVRINEQATQAIAMAALKIRAKMVYIGSCGIFDGTQNSPYAESVLPRPLTRYAASKLAGEGRTLDADAANLVCRVGWLFGGSRDQRKNFVEARRRECFDEKPMISANDKWGSPTWGRHAAKRIVELLCLDASGVHHVANTGIASRHDYVNEIVKAFNPLKPVTGVDSSHFPRSAPVPDCEALTSQRLSELSLDPLPDWRKALLEYIQTEYFQQTT